MSGASRSLRGLQMLIWSALAVFVLDQISKLWVTRALDPDGSMIVVPGFANFILSRNTGMVFGILNNLDFAYKPALVTFLSLAALLGVGYLVLQSKEQPALVNQSLGLILGGALGNIVDRVRLGYVVDFIDVYYRHYHWHTFNVADSAISVGVAILLWQSLTSQIGAEEIPDAESKRR